MSGLITTGSFPKLLWPGLNKIWGDTYAEHAAQYLMLFDKSTSDKNYEEDVAITTFGLVPVKPEGSQTVFDTMQQIYVSRYTHVTYGLGFIVTEEEMDDNLYMDVGERGAKALAFSYNQTRENIGANVYNNGFSGGPTYGDGQTFFSTAHPSLVGSQSNILSPGVDLSEAALEQISINIDKATDLSGKRIALRIKRLAVAPENRFEAKRILGDPERPGTADRDINAMYWLGTFGGGYTVNNYFTDPDAYFVLTELPDAVRYFERKAASFAQDNDFSTRDARFLVNGRYSFGVTDWHGAYASQGA